MTYTGFLRAADSRDSLRVDLTVNDDVLEARDETGASWDIALDRVRLVRWSNRELQLELAGEPVRFEPDEPEAVVDGLVPILLVRREQAVTAAPGAPAVVPTPEEELVVDLTDEPVPAAPTRTSPPPAPWPEQPTTVPIETGRSRRGPGRALIWALIAAGLAAVALVTISLTGDEGPGQRARAALDAAGLTGVAVDVEAGTAELTGTVETEAQATEAESVLGAIDGIDAVDNRIEVADTEPTATTASPTTVPDPDAVLTAASRAALTAAGLPALDLEAAGARVAVGGAVASEAERRTALAALFGVDGVEEIDNRLTVTPVADATVQEAARAALDAAGFAPVTVVVEDGIATLTGVVPLDVLADGLFQYSDRAENIVAEQAGVSGIRNRLQLTGDAATLRDQLRSLTEAAPVTFALGDATLTAAGRETLDGAAGIIRAQPGLRVLIAGHTDTTGSAAFNEQLSQERADAVRQYLIEQGIAANRLVVVAYGELFPSTPGETPLDRRVEFEVAG